MKAKENNMEHQLYIQILAQYNPKVLRACYCEKHVRRLSA